MGKGVQSPRERGRRRFALYAYPPNELGYCGPDDPSLLATAASGENGETDLSSIARQFSAAWPYLRLIAEAAGAADPLEDSVVAAYWLGGELASGVREESFAGSSVSQLELRTGRSLGELTEPLRRGAPLQHNYHVFVVYPWLGVLRRGGPSSVLSILDGCRIRKGVVRSLEAGAAMVETRELVFDGHDLCEGAPRLERVRLGLEAIMGGKEVGLKPGDTVSVHWDWLCEPLSPEAEANLDHATSKVLAALATEPAL